VAVVVRFDCVFMYVACAILDLVWTCRSASARTVVLIRIVRPRVNQGLAEP
jgi:hypothetical protein